MRSRRLVAGQMMLACLCGGSAAIAQAPPSPAPSPDRDIVVQGRVEARSAWKRAETDHVVAYSMGSEEELKRVTRNLELLHGLMTRLYRRGDTSDDAGKLHVTLIESDGSFAAMGFRERRAQEGPFPRAFPGRRFYDPGEDGEVLAIARSDQTIDLNTNRRWHAVCDKQTQDADNGAPMCGMAVPRAEPLVRSWEASLYSAYAQHFLLTYQPAAYPRWYLDGIGALFSTIAVRGGGAMDYAVPPEGYKRVFEAFGYPDVGAILSGTHIATPDDDKDGWSPYGAWLLAHYFLYSNLRSDRQSQFQQYMAAVREGRSLSEAAIVFGDMRQLQREVQVYAEGDIGYARAAAPQSLPGDPIITRLSASGGALVEARAEMEAHLAADGGAGWLGGLRDRLAAYGGDREALQLKAEAECREGDAVDCLATAGQLLALAPDDAAALAWKGVAQTDQALAAPPGERPARLAEARGTLQQALARDGQSGPALIAYFQSFARAGEPVPPDALRDIALAIRANPAAPGPRLYLAQELVRQGKPDVARRVLTPVLYGGYDSPEKDSAVRLLAASGPPAAH